MRKLVEDTNNELQEFAESVPMEELFDHIKELTGLHDLSFGVSREPDRRGRPRIQFDSQDLSDRVGFLKLLFKHLSIGSFGGEIRTRSGIPYYWVSVAFSYTHPSGGMNGYNFCDALYEDGQWTFRDN